jgi:hypothetical protein
LLLDVVEERLLGMGPLVRHCLSDKRHDELLAEQAALLRLVDRLRPMLPAMSAGDLLTV